MKVGAAIGVGACALLLCAPAVAQTPTPDPAPLPPPAPSTTEPSTASSAEVPSTSNAPSSSSSAHARKDHLKRRERVKKPTHPGVGPFHSSVAELGLGVLTPVLQPQSTGQIVSDISAGNGSTASRPRPVVIGLALVLVFMAGVVLVVSFQY